MRTLLALLFAASSFSAFAYFNGHQEKTGMHLTLPQHTTIPQRLENYCFDSKSDMLVGKKPVFNVVFVGSPRNGNLEYKLIGYEDVQFPRTSLVDVEVCKNKKEDRNCETVQELFSYTLSGVEKTIVWNKEGSHSKVIAKRNWSVPACATKGKY